MGNCSFKAVDTKNPAPIRVMTDSGQVLEFDPPKVVSEVVDDFPRHGVFWKGHLSSPLSHHEQLLGGQFYYLFPLAPEERDQSAREKELKEAEPVARISTSTAEPLGVSETEPVALGVSAAVEPVRISTSAVALGVVTKKLADGMGFEVLPPPSKGVWKVKLMITTKQLEEILSEEVNTEALIEQMRVAAASSMKTALTPRQSKGYWGVNLKPIFCNVFDRMLVLDDHQQSK